MYDKILGSLSVAAVLVLLVFWFGSGVEASENFWNQRQENSILERSINIVSLSETEKVIEGEVLEVYPEEDRLKMNVYSTPHVEGGEKEFKLLVEDYDLAPGEHIVVLCQNEQIIDILLQPQEI
ncbi:MAG: hypothetical protein ACOCZM_00035 [Bacillota bacterium]